MHHEVMRRKDAAPRRRTARPVRRVRETGSGHQSKPEGGLVMAGDFDVQLLRTVAKVRSGYAFKSEVKGAVGPPVIRKKTWCRHGGHHGLRTCARRSDFEYSKVVTAPGQYVKLGVRH